MPAAQNGQTIKKAVLEMITESIGKKTADMYRDSYAAQSPEEAVASAEELLAEFVGRQRAVQQMNKLRATFKLTKARTV